MAQYLLIARFPFDDIPLALLKDKSWAEKHAKDLHADPSLLTTKWKSAMDIWPKKSPGELVDALVLHLDVMGDPVGVTFDSTYDDKDIQPPEPQPIESTIQVPDGYVEITDPNHSLRPHLDLFLAKYINPGKWVPITDTDAVFIRDWCEPEYRFCCPATHHPDLQGASVPAETDELKVLREANEILITQLHKTVGELLEERSEWMANNTPALEARYRQCERHAEELQAANVILKKENDHLQAEILILQTEIGSLHTKMQGFTRSAVERSENDEQAFGILRAENSDLRRLNEDLNNRLKQSLARASHATDLESRIRRMAINFVQFHAKLRERLVWSSLFATEKQMPPAYTQALMTVDSAFTDVFVSFLQSFPHVQPDMPDEWQIDPAKADDDDGTTD